MSPSPEHLIRLSDLSDRELEDLLDLAGRLKRRAAADKLQNRSVGLLFFRGSLRTRTAFESAMHQLGGHTVHLAGASDFWELEAAEGRVMDGRAPEHVKDAAAVLSSYVDALAIRPPMAGHSWASDRRDEAIAAWARWARVPVVNMESAMWHPLQALSDLMTMREALGNLKGKRLAIVWTHSPTPASPAVVHSLIDAATRAGMDVRLAHPPGYELDEEVARVVGARGQSYRSCDAREEAVEGAQVVYARSWWSLADYGNPTLAASRRARTHGWKVDGELLARGDDARFLHAMPVRRNMEASDEVLDGPRSLVVEQAANRLHATKAVLLKLLKG
ncbi:MAG: hypothetical protein RL112_2800 [Planctomycetota bacterium]